jgi:energy-coupling factor transporter ATP-binding protein EcfA2
MNPFNHNYFLGYVNEVTPQYIKIHFPSSVLLSKFHFEGINYAGGNVGNFVVIEGEEYGFLAQLTELKLSDSERKELTEKAIEHKESDFHPIGKAELLLSFSVFNSDKVEKTVSKYPSIGAKVYSCSDKQIGKYVKEFGKKDTDSDNVYAILGKLTSNDAECHISLNSLFGRHCAVVGTTGGGKSWTVSKLIESITTQTSNKVILIDATGEYSNICLPENSITIGNSDCIFPYSELTIDELYFLLKPSSKVQVPKLMEAIRSLKIVKLLNGTNQLTATLPDKTTTVTISIDNGIIKKAKQHKRPYEEYYYKNYLSIEDKKCNFIFSNLAKQITQECIWDSDKTDVNKWGDRNETDLSNCISLISRIGNLMNSPEYNNVFDFANQNTADKKIITTTIDDFIEKGNGILRLDFSQVDYDFQVREVLVNSIGKKLLVEARSGKFKNNPIIVFIDEAHQFLNKTIKDEYFDTKSLDSFEIISKESRKYGLFLCLTTQMPRDIPIGTLSQMGTFIVHRLINEKDKQSIENAASSANRNSLSFLPILGEGEALLIGVDFPMPLLIKIDRPNNPPKSDTPRLKKNN